MRGWKCCSELKYHCVESTWPMPPRRSITGGRFNTQHYRLHGLKLEASSLSSQVVLRRLRSAWPRSLSDTRPPTDRPTDRPRMNIEQRKKQPNSTADHPPLTLSLSSNKCVKNVRPKCQNVITIIVSKMTSHCAGTVQMTEVSESGIRKWEEMWFKTTAEHGERWAAVTCDGRLFHRRAAATGNALSPTLDRRIGLHLGYVFSVIIGLLHVYWKKNAANFQ